MVLYLLNIRVYISVDIAYISIIIPRVAIPTIFLYSFSYIAIDHVVGVAFPYCYRNIMKPRVVYASVCVDPGGFGIKRPPSRTILGKPKEWGYCRSGTYKNVLKCII